MRNLIGISEKQKQKMTENNYSQFRNFLQNGHRPLRRLVIYKELCLCFPFFSSWTRLVMLNVNWGSQSVHLSKILESKNSQLKFVVFTSLNWSEMYFYFIYLFFSYRAVSKPLGSLNNFMKKEKKNTSLDNVSIQVTQSE